VKTNGSHTFWQGEKKHSVWVPKNNLVCVGVAYLSPTHTPAIPHNVENWKIKRLLFNRVCVYNVLTK
jgi:hypothetical protein